MFEHAQVTAFVVAFVILPAAEDDADPFEGQGTDDGVVLMPSGFLLRIIETCPDGMPDRFAGVFVEALAQELWTALTPMDVVALATLFENRSDATEALQSIG